MRPQTSTAVTGLILVICGMLGTPVVHAQSAEPQPVLPAVAIEPIFAPVHSTQKATSAGVTSAIKGVLAKGNIGKDYSAYVIDADSGNVLFEQKADSPQTPASSIKVLTSLVGLTTLDVDYRFQTKVLLNGSDIYVVGGGDPTLMKHTPKKWLGKPAGTEVPPSVDELVQHAVAKLDSSTKYSVHVDDSLFAKPYENENWKKTFIGYGFVSRVQALTMDYGVDKNENPIGDTALEVGKYFAKELDARGVKVKFAGRATAAGNEIATVQSARLIDVVERMLTTSNNTFAEYVAHAIGGKSGEYSFARGAEEINNALADLDVPTDGNNIVDGSGLSYSNKVTARELVEALRKSESSAQAWGTISGLPIAGVSGTLADRFGKHDSGRGYVRAKTGTLTGVVSLTGTVVTKDGDNLYFAFLADKVPSGANQAQHTIDLAVQKLADCGCSK